MDQDALYTFTEVACVIAVGIDVHGGADAHQSECDAFRVVVVLVLRVDPVDGRVVDGVVRVDVEHHAIERDGVVERVGVGRGIQILDPGRQRVASVGVVIEGFDLGGVDEDIVSQNRRIGEDRERDALTSGERIDGERSVTGGVRHSVAAVHSRGVVARQLEPQTRGVQHHDVVRREVALVLDGDVKAHGRRYGSDQVRVLTRRAGLDEREVVHRKLCDVVVVFIGGVGVLGLDATHVVPALLVNLVIDENVRVGVVRN